MKREICDQCQLPKTVCLCAEITEIAWPGRLVILQHPKEAGHAKNTVRLMRLCLPKTEIYIGENSDDFAEIANEVSQSPERFVLVYPNEHSEDFAPKTDQALRQNKTFILIDATWRKALKMWLLNPWLKPLKSIHFSETMESQYLFRKRKQDFQLSTLEAVHMLLKGDTDTTPLLHLLNVRNHHFQSHK